MNNLDVLEIIVKDLPAFITHRVCRSLRHRMLTKLMIYNSIKDIRAMTNINKQELFKYMSAHTYAQLIELHEDGLHYACLSGNLDIVKYIYYNTPEIDNEVMSVAVVIVVRNNRIAIMKFFINNDINIPAMSINIAAKQGNLDMIKLLVRNYLNISALTLVNAIDYNHLHVTRYLLTQGSVITNYLITTTLIEGKLDMLKLFVEFGYQLPDNTITIAAAYGYIDILKYAHSIGFNLPSSLLLHMSKTHAVDIFHLLIQNDITPSVGSIDIAVRTGNFKLVKLLSNLNTDIPYTYLIGQAAKRNHFKIVRYLYNNSINADLDINNAIASKNINIVQYYINNGAKLSDKSMEHAIMTKNITIVQCIHKYGAIVNPEYEHLAIKLKCTDIIIYLYTYCFTISSESIRLLICYDNYDVLKHVLDNINLRAIHMGIRNTCSRQVADLLNSKNIIYT